MQTIALIGSRTAGLVPGLAVLTLVAYAALFVAGYRTVAVYSGSMEPELHVGSLAFVKSVDSEDVRAGDVITFQDPRTPGRLITHRVVERFRHDGRLVYRTKGDANPTVDPWTIALPGTVGRTAFDVPVVGYALVYAKTREVRTALLLLFAAVLLLWLLAKIWRTPRTEPAVEPIASPAVEAETSTRSLLAPTGLTLVSRLVRAVRA